MRKKGGTICIREVNRMLVPFGSCPPSPCSSVLCLQWSLWWQSTLTPWKTSTFLRNNSCLPSTLSSVSLMWILLMVYARTRVPACISRESPMIASGVSTVVRVGELGLGPWNSLFFYLHPVSSCVWMLNLATTSLLPSYFQYHMLQVTRSCSTCTSAFPASTWT